MYKQNVNVMLRLPKYLSRYITQERADKNIKNTE